MSQPSHSSTETNRDILTEYLSHNMNYRAVIFAEAENFEVCIFFWSSKKQSTTTPAQAIWERIAGPFILDTLIEAEQFAQDQLHLLSGEIIDTNIPQEITTWLQEYAHDHTAEFLDPKNFEIRFFDESSTDLSEYTSITAKKIVATQDLYFIEQNIPNTTKNSKWLIGVLEEDGILDCFASFDSLQEALDAAIKRK